MYKNLHIPLLMLAAAAIASACCKKAPEPQPLVIRATLSNPEASPQSRATIDGTFDGGEEFGIAVNGGGIYHYTADTDGTLTSEAPYYWAAGSSDQYIDIRAWSPYDGENDIPSAADKILPDQSTLQAYRSSDLIVATGTLTPGNTALRFTHATARLTFNLKSDSSEPLTAISDVKVAGISSLPSGTAITPYRPAPSANSFSALVPDGTIPAGAEVLTFKREGFNYSWTADKDYALSPDTGYTFDISVSTDNPQITLTGCTISGWELGASYEENVPIPDNRVKVYVNLAELTEEYVINDDECYVFSGSGSYGIKVTAGNPEIYLENAQISVSSGHAIDIQGGNPTIHVRGKDNQVTVSKGEGAGIYVAENYTVTITGNSTEDAISVTGSDGGAGIGGQWDTAGALRCSCGNINISNVTITAKGSMSGFGDCASGIGAAGGGTVGSISISNAIVYAEGGGTAKNGYYDLYGAAAIGGGFDGSGNEQTEFDITISNSTIHATKSCSYATYIGRKGELNDPANYDIISSARITDSTIYKYAYGPSGGDSPSSDGSVVYDANGNRTDQ